MQQRLQNVKNEKCITCYFSSLSSCFVTLFFPFHILQHFVLGSAFTQKFKRFRGLFFRGINKIRNLHEIRKVYSECFIFHGMFCENIPKIPVKYEKCIAGLREFLSLNYFKENSTQLLTEFHSFFFKILLNL